ncbi:ATP-dependent DNA helicase PIF1-like [Chenopodium quinoa]|uniref:ATP-dependent DNA helicase PIF1-like n=1 Tax=Chenopodium quinoa TaxID=63459 RepID=UPI000B7962D6|nr:ATP-dependent DNA helicase PIF1-like [Chenopodium quinoa]
MEGNLCAESFINRAILTPLNDEVDSINAFMIEQFQGRSVKYKSFDTMLNDSCNVYPTKFMNSLCPGGMSPHELVLKENCPVILLHNLLLSSCYGTRLTCKCFFPNVIQCVIATRQYKGDYVFIHRINLRPSGSLNYPFQFERKQFPIKLSFAMTINKSQGQTLNQVSIHLPRPCFSHGQLYVALSKAKKAKDVAVFYAKPPKQYPPHTVKNVVAYEVPRLAGNRRCKYEILNYYPCMTSSYTKVYTKSLY